MLSSTDTIICFDNFESPWDQDVEVKHSVEELLSRVTEISCVTVLITMRGAERPARTRWTQPFLKPLETLDHDAAKEIWQAIAGNYDNFSEKLIEAVDYVPLAIDLLSHLSQVMLPSLLWREWSSKQTKAVQKGQEHRLSSLEYSIQISINSGRMKANVSAKNLLGVLCILPDGLHMKHLSKFDSMLIGLDITSCLQTLLQCSLIKLNEERYQPHPIIQCFCLNQCMVLPEHKNSLEDFYIALACSDYQTSSPEVYEEMVLEVNNTKFTLLGLLKSNYKDQSKLIEAANGFTTFCINIGDHSDEVISLAIECIQKDSSAIALLIKSLLLQGILYYYAYKSEKAQEKLEEAEKLCLSSSNIDSQSYGAILEYLGDVHVRQNAVENAEASFQKALKVYVESNDILGQGNVYSRLGQLYRSSLKLDKAIALFHRAIAVNAPHSQGNGYRGLGQTFSMLGRQTEAGAALKEALKLHKALNSEIDQGNDHLLLGGVYLELGQLDDAIIASHSALEFHNVANHLLGQGNDHELLAKIYLHQGKLNEAESSYKKALELHKAATNTSGQGNDCYGLGKIYMKRGQLYDAQKMFEKAISLHRKAQARAEESLDEKCLNEVLTQMKQ